MAISDSLFLIMESKATAAQSLPLILSDARHKSELCTTESSGRKQASSSARRRRALAFASTCLCAIEPSVYSPLVMFSSAEFSSVRGLRVALPAYTFSEFKAKKNKKKILCSRCSQNRRNMKVPTCLCISMFSP